MTVTVDHQILEAERLGLRTVGQVLNHVRKARRLVVNLLIDGRAPDPKRIAAVKQAPLTGHTLYIETAEPRKMALDVLAEVESQLDEAERLRQEAAGLLNQAGGAGAAKALERLSGCFSTWNSAQQSVLKTAQLLRIDLTRVHVPRPTATTAAAGSTRPLCEIVHDSTALLQRIKSALEQRDLADIRQIVTKDLADARPLWRSAVAAVRDVIDPAPR